MESQVTKRPCGQQKFSFLQWVALFFQNISIFWLRISNIFQLLVQTKMTMTWLLGRIALKKKEVLKFHMLISRFAKKNFANITNATQLI